MEATAKSYGFYVITYDISDDRRRLKIARLCESMAERVQASVFEGYFTSPELEKLLKKIKRVIKVEEDSVRVYTLCAACRKRVQVQGQHQVTPPPGVKIIV